MEKYLEQGIIALPAYPYAKRHGGSFSADIIETQTIDRAALPQGFTVFSGPGPGPTWFSTL